MLSFKQHSSPVAIKKPMKPLHEGISLSPSDFIVDLTDMDENDIAENYNEVTLHLKMKKQRVAD